MAVPRRLMMPVAPRSAPIVPQSAWQTVQERDVRLLVKTMSFVHNDERNRFLRELLGFEEACGHTAEIVASDRTVTLRLTSHDAKIPLDDDRAYAMFVDDLYRDVSFESFVQ